MPRCVCSPGRASGRRTSRMPSSSSTRRRCSDELLFQPRAGQTVIDLAYRAEGGETAHTAAARAAGCEVVDGLEVARPQGAASFELWTGLPAPVDVMRARSPSRLRRDPQLTTAGESHGPALVAILTGLPAGLELDRAAIDADLHRRQQGYGRSPRQQLEQDEVEVLAGPPARPYARHTARARRPQPRPQELGVGDEPVATRGRAVREGNEAGHAAAAGPRRPRGGAQVRPRGRPERARARERAAHCRLRRRRRRGEGAARGELGITVEGSVLEIGGDGRAGRQAIDAARADRDTLGGIVEVRATGVFPGLGSYATREDRLDGRFAAALMSIQAVKGVEIGDGLRARARAWLGRARRDRARARTPLESRRRARGRRLERRGDRRPGGDEAAADADAPARFGRSRDGRGGAGARRAQ